MAVLGIRRRTAASLLALIGTIGLLGAFPAATPARAGAGAEAGTAASNAQWFDDAAHSALTVSDGRYLDGYGREVTLRGFNVSGEAKLAEDGRLPFASVADAQKSAAAMRGLTGGDAVRFAVTWAGVEPQPGQIDYGYLRAVAAQMQAFLDAGVYVFVDFHQDLYSRYIFNSGSWYTGDGAPQWVIANGGYPTENCGICVTWGQNITSNAAVEDATYDFWHNRTLTTSAGRFAVQSEYQASSATALAFIRTQLSAAEFDRVLGVDPFNEPYAGKYDSGQTSTTWERDLLWPFYQAFRAGMDNAGWQDKSAFIEPEMFWNSNLSFEQQPGGLTNIGTIGSRYVFNSHFYDEAALSGVFMWGGASDGQYVSPFNTVRDRATALGTSAMLSEFGSPVTGYTSDKSPSVLKAMYQALDSRLTGANWWNDAKDAGTVLSATEWQWDIYNGRHHELMNGNPSKVETTGDGWNGEDYSVVATDAAGTVALRYPAQLLDRVYPQAVAGTTLAFTYEDRAPNGSTTMTWNPVPSSLPTVSSLVGTGQYAMLVWKSNGGAAPTQLDLPLSFPATGTTVISDLGAVNDPPAYSASGQTANAPIAVTALPGGSAGAQRLLISDSQAAGTVHYALVTNGSAGPTAAQLAAAQQELTRWTAAQGF